VDTTMRGIHEYQPAH